MPKSQELAQIGHAVCIPLVWLAECCSCVIMTSLHEHPVLETQSFRLNLGHLNIFSVSQKSTFVAQSQ